MKLVLLTFGENLENHNQASFSILSFLSNEFISGVTVVTDKPEYYKYFGENIDLVVIDKEIMKKWRGKYDFFWRIKMKAIESAIAANPNEDILYVDSDTIIAGKGLKKLQTNLDLKNAGMHEKEGDLSELKSKTERKMWKSLKGLTFSGVTISKHSEMWNAGVIFFPKALALEMVELSIKICDEICATNCPRRLVEQLSFSLALFSFNPLVAVNDEIVHYWGNKDEWNKNISRFFSFSLLSNTCLEDDIQRIKLFNYAHLPIIRKEKNTKHKLINLINKVMQPKMIKYFSG